MELWPDAEAIDVDKCTFSDRFPKPDWYGK